MKMDKRNFLWLKGNAKIGMTLMALIFSVSVFAQREITVRGVVLDEMKEPLIGASVQQKGQLNGIVTDLDGKFSLQVAPTDTLVVSYLGYVSKNVPVKGQTSIEIILGENTELIDEVVVIGYGSVKRKDVTTAISSVSTKDLDQRPILSAAQAIQGKAAGVSVSSPNGAPGAGMTIRVRGTTSFNGSNDPLYVVDGVPMTDISYLASDDIESMQILKDASSAAIYGSRAANGVIMITTKSGAKGQARIALNAYLGVTDVVKSMTPLNVAQYKELMDEIGMVKLPDGLKDETNWFDETYQTGMTQNYQLSVSNGNDNLKYYISGGYTREEGVIKVAFYERYNFRANIENQIRKWINIGANVAYSDYSSNGIISGQGANRAGVVLSAINTPTYGKIWDDNNPGQYYTNFYGVNVTHPVENMSRSENNQDNHNRMLATGKAEITFLPELKFKSSITMDRLYKQETRFLDPTKTSYGRSQHGEASDNRQISTVLVFDNILNWTKTVNRHAWDVMAGASGTTSTWSQSYQTVSHFRDASIKTLNAGNKVSQSNGTSASEWAIMSYVGRVSYNFDSKYLVSVNMRADGSSKLHPDYRWGYFPSASAAWRISGEDFMKDITWLDDLKLRAGWGQTGNQSGLGDYAYLMRYWIGRENWWEEGKANAVPNIGQANLRTKDLKWETTTQTNIGIDLTVLKNRLTVNMDYYYKRTSDMLMNVTLPAGQAASSIARNEGEMTNSGFEFSIDSKNMQGKFEWNTNFNISFNKNKLTKLELTKIYNAAKTSESVNEFAVRNEPGRSLGGFYGYISDGVDPETGELMYRDVNGDGVLSTSDRTYIGDPNALFTYGMTNFFSYKGFSLNIMLQGSYGNDIFNASKMETEGMYDGKNQTTQVLKRWKIPGQITDMPKAGFDMRNSSYYVEDGSYLRVKDISLAYNVKVPALRKMGITRLQPYFTATNLLTWTNYSGMDPEVNQWGNNGAIQGIDWGTYPQTKSFVFGVNVEF